MGINDIQSNGSSFAGQLITFFYRKTLNVQAQFIQW